MKLPACTNCSGETLPGDLVTTFRGKIISVVCSACTDDVKKPRLTFTRANRTLPFQPEQYSCVETFR